MMLGMVRDDWANINNIVRRIRYGRLHREPALPVRRESLLGTILVKLPSDLEAMKDAADSDEDCVRCDVSTRTDSMK